MQLICCSDMPAWHWQSLQGGLQGHVGGLGGARHDNRHVRRHITHVEHPLRHNAVDTPVAIHNLQHTNEFILCAD